MTEKEFLEDLKNRGFEILQIRHMEKEGAYQHCAVAVAKKEEGDIIKRKWIHYYLDLGGNVYWQERNQIEEPSPTVSFTEKVNQKIKEKIEDNTLKYGEIERINDSLKRAIIFVILADKTEKKALVSEDNKGKVNFEIL